MLATHLAVWSSGVIPASGAGGPGSNSRNGPVSAHRPRCKQKTQGLQLQTDTCGIRTHAGRPHRLSRPTPLPLGQSVIDAQHPQPRNTNKRTHTNAHTPATHAPLHTTRAPSGNTTQTLARPTGERTNMHAANTRRCNTPIGVANGKLPRGPMDKASAHGAGDCRFESCRGHLHNTPACRCHLHNSPAAKPPAANTNKPTPRGFEPLRAEPNGFRVHP